MKYLNVYLIFSFAFFVTAADLFSPASQRADFGNDSRISLTLSVFSPDAQTAVSVAQSVDSLALVDLYNSTNGWLWTNRWNLANPVSSWFGIQLDAEGYVTEIHLNNNRLSGTLTPSIGNLSRLQYLQIDNNSIGGTIPPEIGQLSNLSILFVDDNNFIGEIPDQLANCSMLMTIFMDNNQFVGAIPPGFTNLINLQTLDIFNNRFDSLPDLSGLNLQFNKFRVYNNNLSFDDIVPNLGNAMNNRYPPQDSVFEKGNATIPTGTYFEIDLGIDRNRSDNLYQWYKNGFPYGAITNSNTLVFSAVDWSDAGTYRCEINNPNAPLLTLYSRSFTINVICGSTTLEVRETLCIGESLSFNTLVYNQSNPTGIQTLNGQNGYGCDSIIDVQLNFYPEINVDYNSSLCAGESLSVNGTIYDQSNPSGIEVLAGAAANGCDSIVNINLTFSNAIEQNISQQLCSGSNLTVNGTIYDQSNPSGTETLAGAAANGCDSIINVNLSFRNAVVNNINDQLCSGSNLTVNGTLYDQSNPTGTETLAGAAANGCDSIININLSFRNAVFNNINDQLCSGSNLTVNGTIYDQSNPSGTETLSGAAANGCDSIINVNLSFRNAVFNDINDQLCNGSNLTVNGTIYDQSNPSGTETLAGAATNGCDSIINVNLSFRNAVFNTINDQLCNGSNLTVNGTIYDQSNPSGTETLAGAAANGCDSIINVNLSFRNAVFNNINDQLCNGSNLTVNGTIYDQSNPSGTETLAGAAASGCDSIININLSFRNAVFNNINDQLCSGSNLTVNGTIYDQSNPTGTETLPGGAASGCDSIINVNLSFSNSIVQSISPVLCPGGSLLLNGTLYDENNPTGTELLNTNQGCDSTLMISLSFHSPALADLRPMICSGESLLINGTVYDEDHPSGTEVLEAAALHGCDSIINVQLDFIIPVASSFSQTLCDGASIVIDNEVFDQSNPGGTVVLEGMSAQGCDSIIVVDLNFLPPARGNYRPEICPGESLSFNGTLYDEGNPSGMETLIGAAERGCDSTVFVELQLLSPATGLLKQTLCEGSQIRINGTLYDSNRPSGIELFPAAAANGCDSILTIDLDFMNFVTTDLRLDLCEGDEIEVNGTLYNQSRPGGTEVFPGGSTNGCDSIVNIQLSYSSPVSSLLTPELCVGDVLVVNGQIYDEGNPAGTEILSGAAANGCDSIINIAIQFNTSSVLFVSESLCAGESLTVNGNVYDQSRPSGMEILAGASSTGCDSVIRVELNFIQPVLNEVNPQLCPGEQLLINGTLYDENHQSGVEILTSQAANGCDSILQIDLAFYSLAESDLSFELCEGEIVDYLGIVYDEDQPSGTAVLAGAGSNGCDSLVHIELQFYPVAVHTIADTICTGATYLINGQSYGLSGIYESILPNASSRGCDSIVSLQLFVEDALIGGEALAGADAVVCTTLTQLNGNLPTGTNGQWSTESAAIIFDPFSASTEIEDLPSEGAAFVWSLSTAHCPDYDRDTVFLSSALAPQAEDDNYLFPSADAFTYLDLLENDETSGAFTFNLLTPSIQGTLDDEGNGRFRFRWPDGFSGELDFTYELCHDLCPDLCDIAFVTILIEEEVVEEEIIEIPNAFTPNGDGLNDLFVIPALLEQPDKYPDAELTVFSRWGAVIYHSNSYQNDWDGRESGGKPLPLGTYYFVLKLNVANGEIFKGDITILK